MLLDYVSQQGFEELQKDNLYLYGNQYLYEGKINNDNSPNPPATTTFPPRKVMAKSPRFTGMALPTNHSSVERKQSYISTGITL